MTLHPQSKSSRTHSSHIWASAARQKLEVGVRNSRPLDWDRFKRSDWERSDHTGTSMLLVHILCCGLLMLCWTQHGSHGLQLKPDHDAMITGQSTQLNRHTLTFYIAHFVYRMLWVYKWIVWSFCHVTCASHTTPKGAYHHLEMEKAEHTISPTITTPSSTVSHSAPHNAPCFVEDIFAALRECAGSDGELTSGSLTLFGICTVSGGSPGSVLLELVNQTSRRLDVLHPAGGKSKLTPALFEGLLICFLMVFHCGSFSLSSARGRGRGQRNAHVDPSPPSVAFAEHEEPSAALGVGQSIHRRTAGCHLHQSVSAA